MRGAGPSQLTAIGQGHAGLSGDINRMVLNMAPQLSSQPVYIMGFSLGANMLLKFLGENKNCDLIEKAVSVSAPLNLNLTVKTLQKFKNRPYLGYLVKKLKSDFRGANWGGYDWGGRDVEKITSIFEYDNLVVAPYHGFDSANDYYQKSSAEGYLSKIKTNTLIIFAKNDPWIPLSVYKNIDWGPPPNTTALVINDGGHLGFHGAKSRVPWYLRAADNFLNIS